MNSQNLFLKNSELVGKKFYHSDLYGKPLCTVMAVCEDFPQDIVFEAELFTLAGKKYIHVEFASFVRKNLV